MEEVFKFEKRYWYPHLKPRDITIWERFILKYPDAYEFVQYDLHIGDPPLFNTLWSDGFDAHQDALYRLKIDVVGHVGDEIHIIELKPLASTGAIGQVNSYADIYARDFRPTKKLKKQLITDVEKPNIRYLCKINDIELIIV